MANNDESVFTLPKDLRGENNKKDKPHATYNRGDVVDIFDLPILPRNRGVNKHGRRYIYEELTELSDTILELRKEKRETAIKSKRKFNLDDILNTESRVGRDVFDNDAPSCEFFMLKRNVWLYYAEGLTIRYEVRAEGVFKKIGSEGYHRIHAAELDNFRLACKKYIRLVKAKLYSN